MWIYICGDNERTYYLREMANKRGHRVTCPDDAQVIVLPLPRSEVSPALSERLHRGQILVCGLVNDELRRKAQAAEWTLHCLYEDEKYQQENAVDSAEGAVFALMREAPFLISGSRCLVIGGGRLGCALHRVLCGMGAETWVAARSQEQREKIGKNAMNLEQAIESTGSFDAVINTVPAQIIGSSFLANMRKGALLMDTASAPYGFNLEEAKQLRIHAWRENGIPGRYCPQTAAKRILDAIERGCCV